MNTQRWMSTQFFSFFVTWGIFLPYWTGWIIHVKEMTVAEAGLIMSLGLVARGVSTLFIFPYISAKYSSKTILSGSALGTLTALLLCIPANSFSSLLVATLWLNIFYPTLMPALDSAAGLLLQKNQLKHYGKSRLWGSVGFVITGVVLTFFTDSFGDGVILWALLLGILVFTLFSSMHTPQVLVEKPQADKSKNSGMLRSMLHLFRSKHFALVLIIVVLIQAAHASYYNYGYLYLEEISVPKAYIGLIINVAVIAEIIFFALADKKFARFSTGTLLTLAALGSTVRWLLIFAFPSILIFSLSQILHAFSFAMAHYAFMKYLSSHIPAGQIPKAQGIYSALALSWSTAVFTLFGSFLYEIEPRYAFIGMIVSSIPAMLLALWYRHLQQKQESTTAITQQANIG